MLPCFLTLIDNNQIVGTGWLPPLPDMRDFAASHGAIAPMAKLLKTDAKIPKVPSVVDLRAGCSPVDNQGALLIRNS